MSLAALTPRVRTIIICDEVSASVTEDCVFTLEGVRYKLTAPSFPCRETLNVFLLLSSSRHGRYSGKMLIVNDRTDKTIRYVKFVAQFQDDNELLAIYIDFGDCVFPEAGRYNFQIPFSSGESEVLKGEHPFNVQSDEE